MRRTCVSLRVELSESLPLVTADRVQLQQVPACPLYPTRGMAGSPSRRLEANGVLQKHIAQ
jgi:hypothetical protein